LFGVSPEPLRSAALNDGGVVLAIVSLLLLVNVQPLVAQGEATMNAGGAGSDGSSGTRALRCSGSSSGSGSGSGGDATSARPLPGARKLSDAAEDGRALLPSAATQAAPAGVPHAGLDDSGMAAAAKPLKLTAHLTPSQKRAFGIVASVVAGLLSGSTFAPPQFVVDATAEWDGTGAPPFPGASTQLINYLFSHFCGIFLSSTAYMMVYVVARRNRPWISAELTLPSFLGGVCWGVATVGWFIGNQALSMTIAYPIITIGPGLVSMAIGAVVYREVSGRRATVLITASTLIYAAASVLIVLSKPSDAEE
jgi:hypothetical protein